MAVSTYPSCDCCGTCLLCRQTLNDLTITVEIVDATCFCLFGTQAFTMVYDADLDAWVAEGSIVFCANVACSTQVSLPFTAIYTQTCGFKGVVRVEIDDCFEYVSMHFGDDPVLGICFGGFFISTARSVINCCPDTDCGDGDTFTVKFTIGLFDAV